MEIADNILIQRCKKRDKDAYCILVERYKKQAYGFAFSYLKNVDDALTISQNAFIRAWNAIKTFEEERSFRSWLFSIIKNLSLNLKQHMEKTPFKDTCKMAKTRKYPRLGKKQLAVINDMFDNGLSNSQALNMNSKKIIPKPSPMKE